MTGVIGRRVGGPAAGLLSAALVASALVYVVGLIRVRAGVWGQSSAQLRTLRVLAGALVLGALWQPVWAGAVSVSRRVTTPTHTLAEEWIRERAPPGTRCSLKSTGPERGAAPVDVRRVANLRAVLDAGIDQLAGCQLVVVQEHLFNHPTLQHLNLMKRVEAGQFFGGNTGIDYGVYRITKPSPSGPCGDSAR